MSSHPDDVLSIAAARENLAEILNRAACGKERLVLTRRGRALAAVVPIEDVELLEVLEDEQDVRLIRERMAEWRAADRPGIALDDYEWNGNLEPAKASAKK